nr:uncharacterized protein LOC112775027 isoform X2 [Arachis hypogaea]
MEVAASTTTTQWWWGRHSTPPSFPRKTSFLRLHPRFPNFTGLGAACGSRRSSEVNVSPWDDKPFEMLPNGKRVYFDEQDVVTFLDPPNELVPLDPSSYNPAAYLWKKIEDIPEERRHRLLLLLKPRLVSIAWQIAGSRYEDSKLVKKSASQLFANSNKDDVMLEYYNCRTTGGPMPLSWINSYRKVDQFCMVSERSSLSRARAPSLPSLSPEAEAAGPGTGHLRRTLSRHRLSVSPAPSLRSSLPEAEATGPGDSSLPPASFAQPEAGPNLVSSYKFPSSFLFCFVAAFDFGAENITELVTLLLLKIITDCQFVTDYH